MKVYLLQWCCPAGNGHNYYSTYEKAEKEGRTYDGYDITEEEYEIDELPYEGCSWHDIQVRLY